MYKRPIAVFDSGVGGLSVWREIIKIMPNERYIYVADTAYSPYGPKSAAEVTERVLKIVSFFISQNVKAIVVACNTATAAAIDTLRLTYPNILFIGMEPAVKPAALHSKSGVIGVLATEGTLKGRLYNKTLERFASDIKVVERAGRGLVEIVENGTEDTVESEQLLSNYIQPMLDQGADHIVLGCTHYPFLAHKIAKIAGEHVVIVDPAPAVASRLQHLLQESSLLEPQDEKIQRPYPSCSTLFLSTGSIDNLKRVALRIDADVPDSCFKLTKLHKL